MKKRLFYFAMIIAVVVGFASCSSEDAPTFEDATNSTQNKQVLKGNARSTANGNYSDGIFILNEGAAWQGDKAGSLIFINENGEIEANAFQKENNGALLGSVPQDIFIKDGNMYIVSQNGGNDGGILTILDAATLKMKESFDTDVLKGTYWPTHIVVSDEGVVFLRDENGIWSFNPTTKKLNFIDGTKNARKNTMTIINDKIFAANNSNIQVIDAKIGKIVATIGFDSSVSGIIRSYDGNIWVSTTSGKISKMNAGNYDIIKTDDLSSVAGAKSALVASFAATPSITAKGDTIYMSGLNTKIYRHIFSTGETKLMIDAKDVVENANIVYNTVAVDPQTGLVYLNTIKGYSEVSNNQITAFDFSGNEPTIKYKYSNYTRFPAGIFFTYNFK